MKALLLLLLSTFLVNAETVYMKPSEFLQSHISGNTKTEALDLTKERQSAIKKLIGRSYQGKRIKYWRDGKKRCFILEEIGKVKPITTGFCVESGKIKEMRVLIYRESHGWEVEKSFFRKQFKGLSLKGEKLSKKPSNIAGATLSVNALIKLSKLALYLDSQL